MYTKDRPTNIMRISTARLGSMPAIYHYRKPMMTNCKCTFADDSVYWQKVIANDKTRVFTDEPNLLYVDKHCTVLADVTRKGKIKECKRMRLIQG